MALRRVWLNINGADRAVVCDNDKDTLSDVLRRIGLTSVKVGCGVGQCGSCTVIYNGKATRSCTRKMSRVNDYDQIETLEGIGTARNLHPLQLAWITYGGVQCGFCTPGFIMSAKALLDENPNPSRQDVRDHFTKNRNLCRCTGYKPLVDAVMAAAAVMRGEMTMEDITFKMPDSKSLVGSAVPKPSALPKVLGVADFGDDVGGKMPAGTLHLALVMPDSEHANILSIDTSEAETMPGVEKVITAKDCQGTNRASFPLRHPRATISGLDHPVLCDEKIRQYGDVVAVVAARTSEEARAAAKLVKVELEELPVYKNYVEAVAPGAMEIHADNDSSKLGPNIYCVQPMFKGEDTREIMENSAHVVTANTYSIREPHLPIEPDIVQAYWDENGKMAIQCKTQFLHGALGAVAGAIGLPPEQVRIIQNPTGGSFGYSMSSGSFAIAAIAVMATGKPCTMSMTYPEFMNFTGKRAASFINGKLAADENGKITALEFNIGIDHGAYSENALGPVTRSAVFLGFPYNIPNINGISRVAFTNHVFGTAYRGYGSPQAYTCSEALVDKLAIECGMDPFEFRYLNIARPNETCNTSTTYKIYPMEEMMDTLRPLYYEAVAKARAESTDKVKRGVGLICGGYTSGMNGDRSSVELELMPDGSVTCYNAWPDVGQGADYGALIHTYEALRPLGLKLEQIHLVMNDTDTALAHGPAAGSRSHMTNAASTKLAAEQLLKAMRRVDRGYYTYDEMVELGIPTKYTGSRFADGGGPAIDPDNGHGDPTREFMFLCGFAEVEVDVATGKCTCIGQTLVSDVGVIGSKLSVEGQAYGGISHTIGYALTEQFEDQKKHVYPLSAGLPQCNEVPDNITLIHHVSFREDSWYGAAGCSENFQSAGHMMVINGIYDAVGIRIYDLPATPEKIKAAMDAKKKGKELPNPPYYLGRDDFYDMVDYLKTNRIGGEAEFEG